MRLRKKLHEHLAIWLGIFILVSIWRVALFGVSFLAPKLLPFQASFASPTTLTTFNVPESIYAWANFDGVHYLTISGMGYEGTALIQAFFPLYPLLMRPLIMLIGNPILAGLLLSFISLYLALVGWFYVIQDSFGKKIAWVSSLGLLVFPMSFFFAALYNESLFLALFIWAYLAVKKKQWVLSGVLAGLLSATRVIGIVFMFIIVYEFLSLSKEERKQSWVGAVLAVLLSSVGLLAFMFHLNQLFGDPLLFFHVQSEFGAGRSESLVLYPQVLWRSIMILLTARPIDLRYFTYVLEFIAGFSGLIAILYAWKRNVARSLIVFSTVAFLIPTLTGTFSSLPRYLLSVPAILLVPTLLATHKNKIWLWLYLGISSILLLVSATLFLRGYWIA